MLLSVLFLLFLIFLNGFFAMSEIALISAPRLRLEERAAKGDKRALAAMDLINAPNRFLSTIQVGITLIGILAGAFGGATLGRDLADRLARIPIIAPYSEATGVGLVVIATTYLSLIIGELVPKRLALSYAERIAVATAPYMRMLSRIVLPIVHILSFSTDGLLRVLRIKRLPHPQVTEEEIRIMIRKGTQIGVFAPDEQAIIERVLRLGDRKVGALMTPRTDIVWIDIDDPPDIIREKIIASGHSRFPVARGSLDNVIGLVDDKDLLARSFNGQPVDIHAVIQPALFVPEDMPALRILDRFKEVRLPIALVLNEYGGLEGLLTVRDVLEAIVGDIPMPEPAEPEILQREDGSWLLDGMLSIDEFKELFHLEQLPGEEEEQYQTLGGFVMTSLAKLPTSGDHFTWENLCIEVVDMDGRRVDKVLVSPLKTEEHEEREL